MTLLMKKTDPGSMLRRVAEEETVVTWHDSRIFGFKRRSGTKKFEISTVSSSKSSKENISCLFSMNPETATLQLVGLLKIRTLNR